MKDILAVIYEKKNCAKCKFTVKRFQQQNIQIKPILIDIDSTNGQDQLNKFKEQGFSSFPIVKIYQKHEQKDFSLINEWSDLKIDMINKYSN